MREDGPTHRNLYVTTAQLRRISIADLPKQVHLVCTSRAGWELWLFDATDDPKLLAGETDIHGLLLDLDGVVIVDSLTEKQTRQ